MSNWALYALTVLIWGSTWIGITFQLGTVDPIVSVGHRFALSALIILCFLLLRRESLRLSARNHGFVPVAGLVPVLR